MKSLETKPPLPFKTCIVLMTSIFVTLLIFNQIFSSLVFVSFVLLFFTGWLFWTFTEYFIHRFLMHELILPNSKDSLFNHQKHHQSPQDLKVKSIHRITFLLIFLIVFILSIASGGYTPILSGYIFGFTSYNFLHYLLHQPFGKYILPKVQRAHILHHYHRPNHGYSFSTTFWDWLFRTQPPKKDKVTAAMLNKFFLENPTNLFNSKNQQNRETKSKIYTGTVNLIGYIVILTSCAPVFSDLQSARTLGTGQVEVTAYYTNTGNDSESKGITHIGGNFGVGISERIDIRGKIDRNWATGEENTGITVLGIGPKFSIMSNRLSFFLPAGRAIGEDTNDTWQIHPTLFFTQPIIKEKIELTLAPKYLFSICQNCKGNFATNLGISGSKDFRKIAWRAEYGRVFTGDRGIGQFSIGVSFVVNPNS